jgi:plastocyanin
MGRVHRLGFIGLLVLTVGLGAGCQYKGTEVPGPNDGASLDFTSRSTVTIDDTGITPNSVRVRVGDAITVANLGTRDHGVTSTSIETGTLHPGESTIVFFTTSGKISAYDRDNPHRRLDIEVVADGS